MDKREQILVRVEAVAVSVFGRDFVFRNTMVVPEDRRPALLMMDGDEYTNESSFITGRPGVAPLVVGLQPEIYLLCEGQSTEVGPALSAVRSSFVKAVLSDVQLADLCKAVKYFGFQTSLAAGRSMEGAGSVNFTFDYILQPSAL